MANAEDRALRAQLVEFLRGGSAHAELKTVLEDIPPAARGAKPKGAAHTAWQLVEHIRLSLHDLLEFSTNANYVAPEWPRDYWPEGEGPADNAAWEASLRAIRKDMAEFERLVGDPESNLYATIPWGEGQTLLREVLLAGQHTSYHLGQIVSLRRELGAWRE